MRMGRPRDLLRHLHWPVLIPAGILLLLGVLALSDLAIRIPGAGVIDDWGTRQLRWLALGLAASAVVVLVPYKSLVERGYVAYGLNLLLLVLVLVQQDERKGSARWISIGGFGFQPSELMKLTLVITLARFIRFRSSYKTFKGLGAPFLLTLLPMALILLQPDLGTALLCIPLLFTTLFVAGARTRHLATILVLGALAIYPVYEHGLKDYQKARIQGFVRQLPFVPESKRPKGRELQQLNQDDNYQVDHSKMAVGTGGWTGVSREEGEVDALSLVPERHNDFIFAVVAHRWGLLGSIFLLATYLWLLCATLMVALRQRDPAGRLICIGVFAILGFQAFINIAMTIGLMPITGMTLPFVSYGGTSLVVSMLAIALVCNVAGRLSFEFGRGDFD
ncbi:MAG: FtsW/RodA/SpoVE family cell cycle protein [Planctomycetota bacterium]